MVRQRVIDYIRSMLQKGYNISAIRDVMLKYGYTDKDIDEAINSIYHPTIRHEIHLSPATIFAIIFIVISISGIAGFFYYSPAKAPAQILDLKLEPVKTEIEAGENAAFIKQISNLGSLKRYDVLVTQELIDSKTFAIITHNTETIALETSSSAQTKIPVPSDTKLGSYILRVIAEYNGKKAIATLPVKVIARKSETCFDGIKNQNEIGIDCGGACKPCEKQTLDCNDNNPCTSDLTENGKCINKQITPCCGNNICEKQEQESCTEDCKTQESAQSTNNLEDTKELAKSDPSKALQQCNQIEVPDLKDTCISSIGEVQRSKNYCSKINSARIKDLCYSNIAKSANDNSLCNEISADGIRDSCYMTFVLDNDDYSVCGRITNKALMQSCESLRQLHELNQQTQNQQ